MPASASTVAVYVAALADASRALNTIERALQGIGHAHHEHGHVWSSSAPTLRETMAGIRRRLGASLDKKAPTPGDELAARG